MALERERSEATGLVPATQPDISVTPFSLQDRHCLYTWTKSSRVDQQERVAI